MTAPGSWRPSHPISRHGRSGRASFITAVRSLDRILREAKLFLAVRDELDGRARSGPSPYRPFFGPSLAPAARTVTTVPSLSVSAKT